MEGAIATTAIVIADLGVEVALIFSSLNTLNELIRHQPAPGQWKGIALLLHPASIVPEAIQRGGGRALSTLSSLSGRVFQRRTVLSDEEENEDVEIWIPVEG